MTVEDIRDTIIQSPMVAIRSILPSLPPAERRVGERVLEAPEDIVRLSIGEVAAEASTSEATVVRFCQKAGFSGYPELRFALASAVGRSSAEDRPFRIGRLDVGPEDSLEDIVEKVGSLDAQAILDTVEQLDVEELEKVVDALVGARRIELYGIGASGLVAIDLEQKLRRVGRPAVASVDGHAALTSAALSTPDDVVLGISHSGETLDVVDPVRLARSLGATTVAITNFRRSSLAKASDILLTTAARESAFRSGAMASRSAQLTVIDCVYLAVAQRNYAATLRALDLTSSAVKSRRQSGSPPR